MYYNINRYCTEVPSGTIHGIIGVFHHGDWNRGGWGADDTGTWVMYRGLQLAKVSGGSSNRK